MTALGIYLAGCAVMAAVAWLDLRKLAPAPRREMRWIAAGLVACWPLTGAYLVGMALLVLVFGTRAWARP